MSVLKDYTKARAPKKVLLRKEVNTPITKSVNAISIVHYDDNEKRPTSLGIDEVNLITVNDGGIVIESCSNKGEEMFPNEQPTEEPPKSQTLEYYLKHDINKKTIDNWIRNNR